jgi:pimeloyl-ACP methyl ester carboxylesterase
MEKQSPPRFTMAYDDAGKGLPVVLLHAFPFSRAMWRPQREALQSECRIITPDLRGFGGTAGFDGAPTVERMADDVAELLDALNITDPAVIGGLSMGGYVALAFARRYPLRLRALILADTRAEADSAEAKANRERLIAFGRTHPANDIFEQMLPKLIGDDTRARRPEVVAEARRIAAAQKPAGIVAALEALRDRPDATPHLHTISAPTLVLVGSEDALTPPAVAQTLTAGISGARPVIIQGAGHLSNLEQPEAFNDAVRGLLRQLA